MQACTNPLAVAINVSWCKRASHFNKVQATHVIAGTCELVTNVVPPGSILIYDETQNNGPPIQAVLAAAGLVNIPLPPLS